MTSTDAFCLRWNDFDKTIKLTFQSLREDNEFADVTLVCEDGEHIRAHKMILATSSIVFKNIMMLNKQSNPVIYMRGIKSKDLLYIKYFIYHGEVNIPQDDLQNFLSLGEEFKLKGLVRESGGNSNGQMESHKEKNIQENEPLALINECYDIKYEETLHESDETLQEFSMDIPRIPPMKFNSEEYKDLDEQIKTMMKKIDHGWLCIVCGKTITNSNSKQNMMIHIEGVHMEDGAHPCNVCGKTYRSRNAVMCHIYGKHSVK